MSTNVIQTAFHSGEWAPALNARVDISKYHSACALALNWYVDYRGGLSTRMGTKYILQAYVSSSTVRLIPFQASQSVGYVMEFGDQYIRFFNNGAPVLETAQSITAITQANPGQVTKNAHGYINGEWLQLTSMVGMTQLANAYVQVAGATTNTFTLQDLRGNAIDTTAFGAFVSGNMARVYTIASPYFAADLALLKFVQNVNTMYICHPDYEPRILRLVSATDWTLLPLQFGSAVQAPTNISVTTTLAAGTVNYSYTVTAVDINGQESAAGTPFALANKTDLRTVAGTNRVTWTAVTGAVRYNVYKTELSYTNAVAAGAAHGFIGFAEGTVFDDSNIAPDFIEAPPIPQNPFSGAPVQSYIVTNVGNYTSVPTVSVAGAPSGGVNATARAVLGIVGANLSSITSNWNVGDIAYIWDTAPSPDRLMGWSTVLTVNGSNQITALTPWGDPGTNQGAITSGSTPANPLTVSSSPSTPFTAKGASATITWGVIQVVPIQQGSGYTSVPAVTFSAGAAAATAVLGAASSGNPSVPAFAFQRLWLMGPEGSPQQFNASKPGLFLNYDISDPTQPDDAISGILVSGQLNEIKAALPMPSGLIIFSNKAAWQIYGASPGQAATAVDVTAQPQSYVGASDVPPIVANDNILYVQNAGCSVRNMNYNFYTNVYTGTDISVLSSHLFYKHEITEWCWAEEPFKIAWVIRDDGIMLSLTFVKEQELIGWTHHDTNGLWKSCASVVEQIDEMRVNAVYLVAERTIDGDTVQYIERMADRTFTNYTEPWCVDAGLQYSGAPATNFSGAEHLAGAAIVGLADGIPFATNVSATGTFTLATPASLVTAGLAFTPDFQSLMLDVGNPTIQAKMKKLPGITLRVEQALGLSIGQSFDADSLVRMRDLTLNNIGTMTNERITDLVTGDAREPLDPDWTESGQFCVRQTLPYPASILGSIPELTVGDDK